MVAQITRIGVRETVPDAVIDRAADIDITPHDLIKRLHDDKVYMPKAARRATENYFSPANLTALREPALRRTAFMMAAVGIVILLDRTLDLRNLALVFLMGGLASTVSGGFVAGL